MNAFVGATILDGTGRVIQDGVVIADGERIVAAGDGASTPVPPGSAVRSCDGLYMIPGLIDAHAHLAYVYELGETTATVPPLTDADLAFAAAQTASSALADGVTTIRDVGDKNFVDVACRRAIDRGQIPGPRILTCGPAYRAGHGTGAYASVADGVDGVRAAVRRSLKMGVDWIKLFVSGEWTYRPHACLYTFDEIAAGVEEAHGVGARVSVHAYGGASIQYSVKAGADSIEHGRFLTDEDIALMREHDTALVNNLLWTLSPFTMRQFPQAEEVARVSVQRPYQAGLRMGIGADAYPVDHALAREAEAFVRMGMSEADVLSALTRLNAEICGVPDRGVIAPGKLADLVVLAVNPLKDIRALRDVRGVIKGGAVAHWHVEA